jgi:citrate lyase subunit beta/citryl-CoA lyase
MMRKAAGFGAYALILDLEDGVTEQAREPARAGLRPIIRELSAADQTIIVRVNGIESGLTGFDLEAVTCPDLYAVMVAKIAGPDEVMEAAHLLNFFERKNGVEAGATLIWPLLETAEGIYRAYETGAASARVAHMGGVGGSGDVGRALGYKTTPEGLETLYLLSKVLLEARAAGVPFPIGGAGSGENLKDVKATPVGSAANPAAWVHRRDAAASRRHRGRQ